MRCRRQAPTGRHANPTLAGGSDEEAAGTNWCRQERPRPSGARNEDRQCQITQHLRTRLPLNDAQRRDLADRVGYGSATTPPGDLTSPTQQTPPRVGPDSRCRQRNLKESWRPGLATGWGPYFDAHVSAYTGDRVDQLERSARAAKGS